MNNTIGIDIGTTHCKLLLVSKTGSIIFSSKRNCRSFTGEDGKHEQDAEEIFINTVSLLKEAFEFMPVAEISCVCFSTAMHSLLAVNENGNPVMNAITWADTRAAKFAKQIKESPAGVEIYNQTGTPIHAMTPLCKLVWLQHTHPVIFKSAARFISIKEYIFYRLFGKYVVDYSIASATGLFNINTREWNATSLQVAGITADKLSTPVDILHAEEDMLPELKKQIGLAENIPFITGCGDGAAAQLGSGALLTNEACVTVGTSGAVRTFTPTAYAQAQQKTFCYVFLKNWFLTGGATNNGGNVVQWFARIFLPGVKDEDCYTIVIALAQRSEAGAKGLLFRPYLHGERSPVWDADATGQFTGIKSMHTINDFARAVLEGILLNIMEIFQTLPNRNTVEHIYANGGFFNSPFTAQLLADISGKKVLTQKEADSSAMGAVYIGMLAQGWIKDITEVKKFTTTDEVFVPDEKMHGVYKEVYKKYSNIQ